MHWNQKNIETFKAIESVVVGHWRRDPTLTDRMVGRAYEALYHAYDAEARGRRPRPHALTGPELTVHDVIRDACERRLGRGAAASGTAAEPPAAPIDEVRGCLRELAKSVERHHAAHGAEGYLGYVAKYLPNA